MLGKVMGFVKSAIEGPEGSAESGFATVLCQGLNSSELKAQRHSAKELSWMCGDDNRHLGLSGGAIQGNRVAVIEAGGLDALVPRVMMLRVASTSAVSEPRTSATATTCFPGFLHGAAFGACRTDDRRHGCWC